MLGAEGGALLWTELNGVKDQLEPTVLSLAFVFLLVGYGTKVGLVPLHNWLPDAACRRAYAGVGGALGPAAQRRAGTPSSAARCWSTARSTRRVRGHADVGFGLLSVVVASFLLSRQKDVKRLFAYSSIEHMGIITFAFGMGGPIANFAALLHMTVHSLTKSAIFFAVGHAAQKTGTQLIDGIRGLITISPAHRPGAWRWARSRSSACRPLACSPASS